MDGGFWKRGLLLRDARHIKALDEPTAAMTNEELLVLRAIAIFAASISLLSGLLVGYWFVKMKRSFRHHLIMLLICSDFWKASWQLIYPAVVLTRGGRVGSSSVFCQVTGFFVSMGIEASDFAILVIAIHSALYIFRPGTGFGEGGLYRYRHYLYAVWVVFPLLMASLAFINPDGPAYNAQGTMCYLPARPIWIRLSLAWVPRYCIMLLTLVLYASIFAYVRIKYKSFRTNVGRSALDGENSEIPLQATQSIPRLPQLHVHGLLPPETPRNESRQLTEHLSLCLPRDNRKDKSRGSTPVDFQSTDGIYDFPPNNQLAYRPPLSPLPDGPNAIQTVDTTGQESTATAELLRRRYAINRQLRLVWIYPIVYVLMWVPPLISHSAQYSDFFAKNPSFWLQCLVSFTLPAQCAVDCWLFATREKPWKYIPQAGRRTFWVSLMFWKHNRDGDGCAQDMEDDIDRREQNIFGRGLKTETRAAYARREVELREARESTMGKRQQMRRSDSGAGITPIQERKGSIGTIMSAGVRKPEVSWWDRFDGGAGDGEDDEDDEEWLEARGRIRHDLESGGMSSRGERAAGRSVSTSPTAIGSRSSDTTQECELKDACSCRI